MNDTVSMTINEGMVIDPRTNTNKFYRTLAVGSDWFTQYGPNDQIGTIGKLVTAASPDAAIAAADKKYATKARSSGYRQTFSGTVTVDAAVVEQGPRAIVDAVSPTIEPLRSSPGQWDGTPMQAVAAAPVAAQLPDATPLVVEALDRAIDSVPTQPGHLDQADPLLPMLASTVEADVLAQMMAEPTVVAQRKYDGDRVLIEVRDGVVTMLNRQGQTKTRNVSTHHTTPFTALGTGRWVFDGEVVGSTLVLFDAVVMTDGTHTWVHEGTGFLDRWIALQALLETLLRDSTHITIAPVNDDTAWPGAKDQLLTEAVARGHEGIVLRDAFSPYQQGLRSSHLVKHKLIKDVDVVISSLHDSKESASLAVHEADGSLREVGAASTIGKGSIVVGSVWVVTYLYVTDEANPRLYQPRLVRPRYDKAATDCTLDQFVGAATNKDL